MALSFIEQFNLARRASAPLIAVCTPDIEATMRTITLSKPNQGVPMLVHDCVQGVTSVNEHGKAFVRGFGPSNEASNPVETLVKAAQVLKEGSILFMANLHRFFHDPLVVQAIWNLRGQFKTNTRTLVILGPEFKLPPEIAGDVLVLDEPLPNAALLEATVLETYNAVKLPRPEAEIMSKSVDALCGLPAFAAEQVCAMSIRRDGMDIQQLWERKRQQIEQTPGLNVWRGQQRFEDVGGCHNIKKFLTSVMNGKDRPRAIVFQDEIEKQLAGAAGDLSGTTQELLGAQLAFMQDHDSVGVMEIGHAGVAKSDIAKAFGNEAGIPTIQLDLGAAKGSLIGESNANMRTILKVIEAVSQGRALWIATSNDISKLAPELRSRYTFGTFFFDLPTVSERKTIWEIYFNKFNLDEKQRGDIPPDTAWTGREIKNCCLLSYRLNISLIEASKYIVPISVSAKEQIDNLRREADGRYISASIAGTYKAPPGMESEETPEMVIAVGFVKPQRKITPSGDKGGGSVN